MKNKYGLKTKSGTNITVDSIKHHPSELVIYGKTDEVGTGEKSPDNPYELISLDSGNANLCNSWNYSNDLFTIIGSTISVQQSNNTITYRIGVDKEFTYSKNKIYIYLNYNGSFTDGAKKPICAFRLYDTQRERLLLKSIQYADFNNCVTIDLSNIDRSSIAYYSLAIAGLTSDGTADYDFTIDVLMCENYISNYFTDEHSIVLSNNDTTIQVPVPIALNSVDDISDYISKGTDGIWKLKQSCKTINSTDYIDSLIQQNTVSSGVRVYKLMSKNFYWTESVINAKTNMLKLALSSVDEDNIAKLFVSGEDFILFIRYSQKSYTQFSDVETLRAWLLDNPIKIIYPVVVQNEYVLSDCAQELLSNFELNLGKNEIYIEQNPQIELKCYCK